ncbi:DUF1652 domain-containing protein [Pseudomonas argentinensis]|uniref:DUF1652 domain-containing protein n=1 Tax=Phytopseudomonas argentinensis TaxID=289370 RepID=UPI0008AA0EE7
MMSPRQQRQLIQAALIPHVCKCTITPVGLIAIQVCDPVSDAVVLEVKGVRAGDLMNWAAIDKFASDLQCHLAASGQGDRKAS